jgi:hypothetical protein
MIFRLGSHGRKSKWQMRSRYASTAFFWAAIAVCGLLGACSDNTLSDGDAGTCSIEPVWTALSSRFVFTASGGLPPADQPDASCQGFDDTIIYDKAAKTLTETGCIDSLSLARVVDLTDGDNARVLAAVGALQTACTKSCVADAPTVALTTESPNVPARTFQSNFYAACSSSTLQPPFVAFDELSAFGWILHGIVSAACDGSDSGSHEAGVCRSTGERDAGAPTS